MLRDCAPTGGVAPSPPLAPAGVTFVSSGEDETGLLAQLLVQVSNPGDVICLYGQVGAGKSVFSRAFIRAVAADANLVVPSPTFLLQQVYEDHPGTPVHHFDLYRLTGPTENFERLGMEESYKTAISLIEWPECLGNNLPEEHLDIHIDMAPSQPGDQVISVSELAQLLQNSEPVLESSSRLPTATSSRQVADISDDDSDEDDLEEDAATDETYSDKRPRRFVLNPQGQSWARRLEKLLGRKQS
ncbi:hypothetical protein KFL_004120190 [Klebsormidium nitens]|uniref:tRNA threonylcarbamoyladenosine biosynthesis protein TsaE n=1 Tax=Klebsormidium nitens TaxID=105231 RepID=A0A1Y1IGR6_KLENI|nr:hypothetical protein KFL_004120190 [Klebsormidium nitens]|eukprot:GAQ88251.1 hypothetical protein KFL_004120190 [Klebsormidium nitens]